MPIARTIRGVVAVATATIGFGLAIALRERIDPWATTAAVALVGIALSGWALVGRARARAVASGPGLLVALALGVALVAATHVAYALLCRVAPGLATTVSDLYADIDAGAHPGALALATLAIVVGEELVWRGVAVELIAPRSSRAATWASCLGLYLIPQIVGGVPILIAAAAALGAIFTAQRLVTGRLLDPLVTHAVWSVSVFVLFPLR